MTPKERDELIEKALERAVRKFIAPPDLSREDIKKLGSPFSEKVIGIKVQSLSKNKDKALLVPYVQHTDCYDRIEEVDPCWSAEATTIWERKDKQGELIEVSVGIKLTIKGVSRENVGAGEDYKGAFSDALKRAAMLFGIGRYLYDSGRAWVDYNNDRDRFKEFTYADYNKALRGEKLPTAESEAGKPASQPVPPKAHTSAPPPASQDRQALNKKLMDVWMSFYQRFPELDFSELIMGKYGVDSPVKLTAEKLEELIAYMKAQIGEPPAAPENVHALATEALKKAKSMGKGGKEIAEEIQRIYKKTAAQLSVGELKNYIARLDADLQKAAVK